MPPSEPSTSGLKHFSIEVCWGHGTRWRRAVSSKAPLQNLLAWLLEVAARGCESPNHMGVFRLGGIEMSPRKLECVK